MVERRGRFPRLSHDEFEQWLLEEALLERYAAEAGQGEGEQKAWRDAFAEAGKTAREGRGRR